MKKNTLYIIVLIIIVFCGYYYSMAPSMVELDSGELATAQATLGIAHPTGYPLFTLLGYIFLQIPSPFSPVFMSNLLALIWTLGSVIVFFYLIKLIFKNLDLFRNTDSDPALITINERHLVPVVFISALIYAFSRTVWIQSTFVEVYSLHLLLITSILYSFFRAVIENRKGELRLNKWWIIFAFLLGLGFTNHLSIIYLLPGIAVLFFMQYKFRLNYIPKLLVLFPVFISPIIVLNLLLMLRSQQQPSLNWGDPSNLSNLIYHISGLQFRALGFAEDNSPFDKLLYFFKTLSLNPFSSIPEGGEFGIFILISFLGIYFIFKISKKLGITFIVFFLTSLLSINYRINDIDAYFLLSYIAVVVFISGGLIYLHSLLKSSRKILITGISIIFLVIVLQYWHNYYQVSQRDVFIYEDFTDNVFNNIDSNAVVFCHDQDPFIATSYYYQFVDGKRKDITKVVTPFLFEKWYAAWLNQLSPGLVNREGDDIKLNINNRPVYISLTLYSSDSLMQWLGLSQDLFIPDGMFFRLTSDSAYIPSAFNPFKMRLTGRETVYTKSIEEYIEIMFNARAHYALKFGRDEEAYALLDDLIDMNIKITPAYWSYLFVQPVKFDVNK